MPDTRPTTTPATQSTTKLAQSIDAAALPIEVRQVLGRARIALTFYRDWMLNAKPGTDTTYPFGMDVESALNAIVPNAWGN